MAEYIDRQEIKFEQWSVGPLFEPIMVVRKSAIDRLPAADVVPVRHGRWIPKHYGGAWPCGADRPEYICSVCGDWTMKREKTYCPNCGAKMDLEATSNE